MENELDKLREEVTFLKRELEHQTLVIATLHEKIHILVKYNDDILAEMMKIG